MSVVPSSAKTQRGASWFGQPAADPSREAYVDASGHLVFEVKLVRLPGVKLGLEVVVLSSIASSGIIIDEVAPNGLVDAWNQRSVEPYRVHSGDIIIKVNNVVWDGEAMSNELMSDRALNIAIRRTKHEALHQSGNGTAELTQHGKGMGPADPRQHSNGIGGGEASDSNQELSQRMMQQLLQAQQQQMQRLQQQHTYQQRLLHLQQWQLLGLQPLATGPQGHGGQEANEQPTDWGRSPCEAGAAEGLLATSLKAALEAPGLVVPSMTASASLAACLEHTFEVYLLRPQGVRLGVAVHATRVGQIDGILVGRICPGGAVDEWNQTCRVGHAIRDGDAIVCINGISLDPQLMMEQVRTRQELLFTVLPVRVHPLFNGVSGDEPLPP